jgi:hypothetical protein
LGASPCPDAVFVPTGHAELTPTDLARGPWDPNAQHGGAPAALLARVIEREAAPQVVTRVTVELLKPVPLAPLIVSTTGRAGRSAGRWESTLSAGGSVVARAHGLSARTSELEASSLDGTGDASDERLPWPDDAAPLRIPGMPEQRSFYYTAMEARLATGSVTEPGPAAVWFRLRVPLVAGDEQSPLARAVAAADFASGTSWILPFGPFIYLNADLTVYLHRMPAGEWVGVDARTRIAPHGIGVTETRLYDRDGPVGAAHQALVVSTAPALATPTAESQEAV